MNNPNEIWQTQVNGEVYEANFEELRQWIAEGSLLPQDKVRRGNLRWIEAQKVPLLHGFFNARELGVAPPVIATVAQQTPPADLPAQVFTVSSPEQFAAQQQTFNEPPPPPFYQDLTGSAASTLCVVHAGAPAEYVCETCTSHLCGECPAQSACPMCGALTRSLEPARPVADISPPVPVPSPESKTGIAPVDYIDEDVKKGANWFYWIAAMSVINSLIIMSGTNTTFAMGLGITQIFDGIADAVAADSGGTGLTAIHGIVFGVDLGMAGFFVLLGYLAGRAKKWAFVIGIILYGLDGLIYLLAGLFMGVAIHAFALFYLVKGVSAIRR